jgi:SAM-dependent methyltransferase
MPEPEDGQEPSPPAAHEQSRYWNDWVARSKAWEGNPANRRRATIVTREVMARRKPGMRILDVGCGSGWFTLELARHGAVTGVDLASGVLARLQTDHPEVEWIGGDFLSLELPERAFDVVTSLETIAHVSDQPAFADRISRVVKPGGTLLLTCQNDYVWRRTSWLEPKAAGQIRDWPSRRRLLDLFAPTFSILALRTCAPGGDRGLPRVVHNRLAAAVGTRLVGAEGWLELRERWGFGCSLVLIGTRRDR